MKTDKATAFLILAWVPAKPGTSPSEEWPYIGNTSLPSLPAKERFDLLFHARLLGEV